MSKNINLRLCDLPISYKNLKKLRHNIVMYGVASHSLIGKWAYKKNL